MSSLFSATNLSFWRIKNPEIVQSIFNGETPDGSLTPLVEPYTVSSMKSFLDVYFSNSTLACGLSPYATPRADFEDLTETINGLSDRISTPTGGEDFNSEDLGYTQWTFDDCKISDGVYGFWLVNHESKDLDDMNAIKEGLAYDKKSTPFKLLNSEDRKAINEMVASCGVASDVRGIARKQTIVFVDLNRNLLITEVVGKNQLEQFLGFLMTDLQFQLGPVEMNWCFGGIKYPQVLTNIMEKLQADNDCDPLLEQLSELRKNGSLDEFNKQYADHHAATMPLATYTGFSNGVVNLYTPFSVMFQGSKRPVGVAEALDAFELLRDYKTASLSGGLLDFSYRVREEGSKPKNHHFYIDISRAPIAGIPSLALYKYETDGPTASQLDSYRKKHSSDIAAHWAWYLDNLYRFIVDFYGKFIVEHVMEATTYEADIDKVVRDVTAEVVDINAEAPSNT